MARKLKDTQAEFGQMRMTNDSLKAENARLNDVMEGQRMKGDYDPSQTKVVHMRFNPFEMMKQKKMEELQELKVKWPATLIVVN